MVEVNCLNGKERLDGGDTGKPELNQASLQALGFMVALVASDQDTGRGRYYFNYKSYRGSIGAIGGDAHNGKSRP